MFLELFSPDIGHVTAEFSPPTAWRKWLRSLKHRDFDPDDLRSFRGCNPNARCANVRSAVAAESDWSLPVVAFDVTKMDVVTQQEVADWLFYWTDPMCWSAVAVRVEGDGIITQVVPREMGTNHWWNGTSNEANERRLDRFLRGR